MKIILLVAMVSLCMFVAVNAEELPEDSRYLSKQNYNYDLNLIRYKLQRYIPEIYINNSQEGQSLSRSRAKDQNHSLSLKIPSKHFDAYQILYGNPTEDLYYGYDVVGSESPNYNLNLGRFDQTTGFDSSYTKTE